MSAQLTTQPDRRRAIIGIGILSLAMLAGSAGMVSASSVDPTVHAGNPDCADLGFDDGFKIDAPAAGDDGTYGPAGFRVIVDFHGNDGNQPTSLDFEVEAGSAPVSGVIMKAGDGALVYAYPGGTMADDDLTAPEGKGISHLNFCYDDPEEVPTPTPDATPTPDVTPTPEASVGGETGAPSLTLPPTDTVAGTTTGVASTSWLLALVILAGVLGSAIVLTPRRATRT